MGFMDAVELMASEAGVPMPERTPREQAQTDRRAQLIDVMDRAVRWFRLAVADRRGRRRARLSGGARAGRGHAGAVRDRFCTGCPPGV